MSRYVAEMAGAVIVLWNSKRFDTCEAAMKEAARLANANPGVEFSVFHMQVSVRIDPPKAEEAVS